MDNEFKVVDIDSKLGISSRFSQTSRYDVQLTREAINKIGLVDGDLIELRGKRTTVARVSSVEKNNFAEGDIGLNNLIRNNARVSPDEIIKIGKTDPKVARRITLSPIGKHLKKSELIKGLAKKSFLDMPFLEGDVTYLKSKMLKYLLGSITWLRVVKTDPEGVVITSEDTEFEIIPDPVYQSVKDSAYYLSEINSEDDFSEKDLVLDDSEWSKLNGLLEIGLFHNLSEAMSFFLREGIKSRSDIFEKSALVLGHIEQLKKNVKELS